MAVTCIVAASAANAPPDEIPAVQYWDLPTHSRVAYLEFNASGERRTYPIVFLHGGPGAYVVSIEPTTRVLSQLRQDGFDVYVYDQVGGGLSQRLPDITQYTVARHVADLEAIRREIRAEKLIISIGSGHGAQASARCPLHRGIFRQESIA